MSHSDKLEDKSDADLIKIVRSLPHEPYYGLRHHAEIELHNRKKQREISTNRMTLWILILTIVLTILTAFLVFSEFKNIFSVTAFHQSPVIQPFPEQHAPTKKGDTEKKNNEVRQPHGTISK